MDSFDLNVGLLSQETFALNECLSAEDENIKERDLFFPFDLLDKEKQSNVIEDESPFSVVPDSPGLIFWLDEGRGTFCIRGFASDDLEYTYQQLISGNNEICNKLKISGECNILDKVSFFPTKSFELAQFLFQHTVNIRFPHIEDSICNLSDPGFYWWLENAEDEICIHFKAQSIDRVDLYQRIGPLGDKKLVNKYFKQLISILGSFIKIDDFCINEKCLKIKPQSLSKEFIAIRDLLILGEWSETIKHLFINESELYHYFKRVALLREFWCVIEKKLLKSNNQLLS